MKIENLEEFLKEISREKLLTNEEELELIKTVQEKGLECEEAERLVKANLRFVVSLVRQYKNRGLSVEELISIGAEELKKSILSYDLNGDINFIKHFVALLRVRYKDTRLEKLSQMLDRHFRHWTEYFTDEETGEEVPVEREEVLDTNVSDEERRLIEEIAADVRSLSDEDFMAFDSTLSWFRYRPFDEIGLELVRRGDKAGALGIHNVATLQELNEKGNRFAAYALYEKYRRGDEEQGIFIDAKKAKEYYDLAGDVPCKDVWDGNDDPGEEDPVAYEYVLTGNAATLDAVQKLINDLCQRFGTPDNECGLFVPQRILMKVLIGTDTEFYRGNVITVEQTAKDRLVITTEADRGEPLLYALRECFENLNIEMKRGEL